jgi:hypothetical protein
MEFILLEDFSDYNNKLTNSAAGGNILSVSVWQLSPVQHKTCALDLDLTGQ